MFTVPFSMSFDFYLVFASRTRRRINIFTDYSKFYVFYVIMRGSIKSLKDARIEFLNYHVINICKAGNNVKRFRRDPRNLPVAALLLLLLSLRHEH